MLVPLSDSSPPPAFADKMSTPGADTIAPVFENEATLKPCAVDSSAATEMNPSETAGGLTAMVNAGLLLSFPAAATRTAGW